MVRCVALIQFSDGLLLDMEWFHYNTMSQVKSEFLVIFVFILDFGMQTVDLGPSKPCSARRRDTCYLSGAITQVKQLAAALAKCQGSEEGEVTIQLFKKLSLTLMRGNALLLFTRGQDAEVDGVE